MIPTVDNLKYVYQNGIQTDCHHKSTRIAECLDVTCCSRIGHLLWEVLEPAVHHNISLKLALVYVRTLDLEAHV